MEKLYSGYLYNSGMVHHFRFKAEINEFIT